MKTPYVKTSLSLHPTTSSVLLPSMPSTTVLGLQSLDSRPKQVVGRRKPAFTIVELLIVIVVIGILAAISIAAYAGISQSARDSSAKASAKQLATKLETTYVQDGAYPAALSDIGIRNTDTTSYQYTSSPTTTPPSWCSTVTVGSTSYYVSNTTPTPTRGGCPGHGQGGVAAVTNLLTNTSVEANTDQLANIGGATGRIISREQVGSAHSGSYVLRVTAGVGGANQNQIAGYGSVSGIVQPGIYTGSLWARSSVSMNINPYFEGSATFATITGSSYATLTPGTWTRLWRTVSVTSAGTVKVGFLTGGTYTSGDYVELDSFMLTSGDQVYNYADGNSSNWIWNGTANASTSTGPAL